MLKMSLFQLCLYLQISVKSTERNNNEIGSAKRLVRTISKASKLNRNSKI